MKLYITILFWLFTLTVFSADYDSCYHSNYKWENNRKLYPRIKEDTGSAVILKYFISNEYFYDSTNELKTLSIVHEVVRINNNDALQLYKNVFLPESDGYIINIRARYITKDGRVIELDSSNIKLMQDDEDNIYTVLSFDGAEAGSEIEYFYVLLSDYELFGREFFQAVFPHRNIDFEIISPSNLKFKFKSYNGFPKVKDSVSNNKNYYYVHADYVSPLMEEAFAYYSPNLARVDYKIGYNTEIDTAELYSWSDAAESMFVNFYYRNKNEIKAINNLYKKLNIKDNYSDSAKITAIENAVKTSFEIYDMYYDSFENLESIIKTGFANPNGIVKLYAALFDLAGINYEIGLTLERDNVRFDKSFQSWKYLDKFVIYLPEMQEYMSPESPELRLGMLPYNLTNVYGLFIKKESIDNYNFVSHKIKFIPPLSFEKSYNDLTIDIDLDMYYEQALIRIEKIYGGYEAEFIQPYYDMLDEQEKKDAVEGIIKQDIPDAEILDYQVLNSYMNLCPVYYPFIISAELKTPSFIEREGNRMIFKIGKVIGSYAEFHQNPQRVLPVENDYNNSYNRRIRFFVPPGYKIVNPDVLNIDKTFSLNNEDIYSFRSEYNLTGNVLEVEIIEFYKEINCSTEHFEEFKEVYNAAAGFNKIVLLLDKVR